MSELVSAAGGGDHLGTPSGASRDAQQRAAALRHVVRALAHRYSGRVDEATVERAVTDTYDSLARSSRVAQFLGILTERLARQELDEVAMVASGAGPGR